MAWIAPPVFVDGDPLTSAQLNVTARDNMRETGPGKATRASRVIGVEGTNRIVERQPARAYIGDSMDVNAQFPTLIETGDDNSVGPTINVQHGGLMFIEYSARINVTSGGGNGMIVPVVNGELPDTSLNALRSGLNNYMRASGFVIAVAEPGLAEVTLAYGASNSSTTVNYAQRRVCVWPF